MLCCPYIVFCVLAAGVEAGQKSLNAPCDTQQRTPLAGSLQKQSMGNIVKADNDFPLPPEPSELMRCEIERTICVPTTSSMAA